MKLESMNRGHAVISGLSPAWVEAYKVAIENHGVEVNQNYMLGTDYVELKSPLLSSLDLLHSLEYVVCNNPKQYFIIGEDPTGSDDKSDTWFFPCVQDLAIVFDDYNKILEFNISGIMEDAISFYTELLDSIEDHVWLVKTAFETSVIGSVVIRLEFDYENDFVDFLEYLVNLGDICLFVRMSGGDY